MKKRGIFLEGRSEAFKVVEKSQLLSSTGLKYFFCFLVR